jgi:hypothetical protein
MLLIAALVVLSGAYYLSTQRNATHETAGIALLPTLANDLNAVTAVIVRKGSPTPTVTVHKTANQWTVAERADYPADVSKLRKLLLAMRDAKIIEEKTADPKRFAEIGVDDPSAAGAAGAEVMVVTLTRKLGVIVGKPVGEGNFVRRVGENRSFSVEPSISLETEARYWIDSQLIDVPVAVIQSVEIKPATGAGYTLRRANPTDNSFTLEGVPAGRKALDGHALAPGSTMLAGLTAEDVAPANSVDFGQASQATVTLTDGNVIGISGTVIADKHWIQVKSSKDAALSAKAQGRAFEIASYRYDAVFKPVDQLLVPKEPPPGKTPPAGKPPAAAPASPGQPAAPPAPAPAKPPATKSPPAKKPVPPPAP